MPALRRLGIYGGAFDPIHFGHLAIAEEARWACGLDQVLMIPTASQPLKPGHYVSAHHRLAMVRLACTGNPALIPSALELERPPPSYTIDTLRICQTRYGTDVELVLIVGADAAADLPRWRDCEQIPHIARLAIVHRPGYTVCLDTILAAIPAFANRITVIEGPQLAISSTDLRRRLADGRPVRYQLPDAVLDYIIQHRLYQAEK